MVFDVWGFVYFCLGGLSGKYVKMLVGYWFLFFFQWWYLFVVECL